jgi:hypothetical protein
METRNAKLTLSVFIPPVVRFADLNIEEDMKTTACVPSM